MFSLGSTPLPKDSWSRFQPPPPLHVETDRKKPTARQSQRNKHLAGGVATYLRHVSLRYEWHHKGLFSGTVCFSTHFLKRVSRNKGQALICLFGFAVFSDNILLTYYCSNNVQQSYVLIFWISLCGWENGNSRASLSIHDVQLNIDITTFSAKGRKKSPWNSCAVVCCLSICKCANCEELLF